VALGLTASVAGGQIRGRPVLLLQNSHADAVHAVAFRPDGIVFASGSADLTIKLWETATGAMLRTLWGHTQRVRAVVFTPDGLRLISTADDHRLIVWDASSGTQLGEVTGPSSWTTLALSPDGAMVAAGTADSTTLFAFRGDSLVRSRAMPGGGALTFNPDGSRLAATGTGAGIWDTRTGRRLAGLATGARCLAWVGGDTLVTAGDEVVLYVAATASPLARHALNVGEHCAISADGTRIAGATADHRIRRWRLTRGASIVEDEPLSGHEAGRFRFVYQLAFSPGQDLLASTGDDRAIKLWDASSGALVRTMAGHADPVESVAFHPGGRLLATGGLGVTGDIQFWELTSGAPGRRIAGRPPPAGRPASPGSEQAIRNLEDMSRRLSALGGTVTGVSTTWEGGRRPIGGALDRLMAGLELNLRPLAFAPDGARLASGSLGRFLDLWDPARGERLRTLTAHLGIVRAVAFSPDGRTFATGGEDRIIKIWDASTFYIRHEFADAHAGMIRSLAFSADGSLLASSAFTDRTVKVWSVIAGTEHASILPDGRTYFMAFDVDGRRLMTCGNRFQVWDAERGRSIEERAGVGDSSGAVIACAVSPDGATVALGLSRGAIRLIDLASGRERSVLSGHDGAIWNLTFSRDGAILVSTSSDSRMAFWDVERGTLLATALSLRNGEDWLVAAPDGLFDGSPGGWQLLRWRFSESLLDTAPAESFFNEFYRPGLLAELIAGQRPTAPREIGLLDRRPVTVSFGATSPGVTATSTRDIEVRITVAEAPGNAGQVGSGARDVRLFRNGSLVGAWRGDVLGGRQEAAFTARVPLVAGENRLTAYAFNRDDVRGPIAEVTVRGDTTLRRKGTLYLLAIGINRYANSDYDLSYAVPDAELFLSQMSKHQDALAGFSSIRVVSLYNEQATRANILAALARLAGRARTPTPGLPDVVANLPKAEPEDAVFVFYAGHGTAFENTFYLIPHDLGFTGSREGIAPAEARAMLARSISDRDLEAAFEGVDVGRLLLIIDACNSGQVLESAERRRGPMNSRGLAQLAYEKGMYVLTASQGYQAALEATQLGHGLLTYALVEDGLSSSSADHAPKDGRILLREWLDFTSFRVPQVQEQLMQDASRAGRSLAFLAGDEQLERVEDRSLQRPRVYYRREAELVPFVVARPVPR
jgi:WD40 repeat protein/uncharacterized caspase-like protein